MVTEEIAVQSKTETFEFTGKRGPFLRLLLINLFLTILTLGIYRFWAKTNVRKFIWSNIRFMGDPLEYTGKATELLLGFLIVLAVLFPLGLAYSAIDHLVPPEETAMRIALEAAYYMVLFALIQVGFYRAWRYRMSRTSWRGIRLGLDGSTWTFLKLSAGWTILTILTLGIAYPWMAIELWRYQITHTRIGSERLRFGGNAIQFIGSWLLVLASIYLPIMSIAVFWMSDPARIDQSIKTTLLILLSAITYFLESLGIPSESSAYSTFVVIVIIFLLSLFCYFRFALILVRYQVSDLRISESSSQNSLPIGRLLWFGSATISGFMVFLALGTYLTVRISTGEVSLTNMNPETIGGALGLLFSIVMIVGLFPMIWTVVYKFEFLKQIVSTMNLTNPQALEHVTQAAKHEMKTGEGLADALDIGGL